MPSDHNGVVTATDIPVKRPKSVRTIRPITASSIENIGQVFNAEKWQFMNPELPPTHLTELFEYYTGEVVDIFCPQKQVFSRPDDCPFITESMKVMKRNIMREYEKRGKSAKYSELKVNFKQKKEKEALKYKEKIIDDVRNGNMNCTYSA